MKIHLESERLIFREMTRQDFGAVSEMLFDSKVMYAWEHEFTEPEVYAWIKRREDGYRKYGYDYFLVENRMSEIIGQIGLLNSVYNGANITEVGWILKKEFFGGGYAFEGAVAIINHAFTDLQIESLYAEIRPENIRSAKLAKRLGMKTVGVVNKTVYGKDMPHDVYFLDRASWTPNCKIHNMRLFETPFMQILRGEKTVEIRLFDEKRRKLKLGDFIIFTEAETGSKIITKIVSLTRYDSFKDIVAAYSAGETGKSKRGTLFTEKDFYRIYDEEGEREYGVIAIGIEVL